MSDLNKAKEVLVKAQQEILRELVQCGSNGGVGRAGNYAPTFVNLTNAIDAIDRLMETPKSDFAERMAVAKKAKAEAKQ
jgi:hypothetical protein